MRCNVQLTKRNPKEKNKFDRQGEMKRSDILDRTVRSPVEKEYTAIGSDSEVK